ncbi:MAG: hypothetical protein H6573_02870 [Lewinellaceae bacterium]|nr:hypothetical protein [Lewinellaceae bacterium]
MTLTITLLFFMPDTTRRGDQHFFVALAIPLGKDDTRPFYTLVGEPFFHVKQALPNGRLWYGLPLVPFLGGKWNKRALSFMRTIMPMPRL